MKWKIWIAWALFLMVALPACVPDGPQDPVTVAVRWILGSAVSLW